jgi:hypothetical protein
MTYGVINPSQEQLQAWEQKSWNDILEDDPHLQAIEPKNPVRLQNMVRMVSFSDQAHAMLGAMNAFDGRKVIDEIVDLTRNPNPPGCQRHWRNAWLRMIKSRYPFSGYHYLIEYMVKDKGHIVVADILHDKRLSGPQQPYARENNMLYNVQRGNGVRYDRPMVDDEIGELRGAWRLGKAVPQITTHHAAVNGMLNDLEKAVWLIGCSH